MCRAQKYPYTSGDGNTGNCNDQKSNHVVKVTNFTCERWEDEVCAAALLTVGAWLQTPPRRATTPATIRTLTCSRPTLPPTAPRPSVRARHASECRRWLTRPLPRAGVNANDAWQFYLGGVMSSSCSHAYSDLDHCVQLVGFDKASSPSYWSAPLRPRSAADAGLRALRLVRNSWGESWGEAGYIYVNVSDLAPSVRCRGMPGPDLGCADGRQPLRHRR